MRILSTKEIENTVSALCRTAATRLPEHVRADLAAALAAEAPGAASAALEVILENADCAEQTGIPLCQDTGMACVFLELGQEVAVSGDIESAVNRGVARGYTEGFLRKSVVADPLFARINTRNNTPAAIYVSFDGGKTGVPDGKVRITVAPKGFGSENKSRIKMLNPTDGEDAVVDFVAETVRLGGGSPCPPLYIGVGIGGTFDKCALEAKRALVFGSDFGEDEETAEKYRALAEKILESVNNTGVGAMGYGGCVTALGVSLRWLPTHIAGLPVAVNVGCHSMRHAESVV
ncbi:MAG: fumarate hydratase [Oscillospiraceae bacterium]|jgi:fumarate hydratase subunit alpha|nr:fumarate hydratase [Oscillospiraceae bacterium]